MRRLLLVPLLVAATLSLTAFNGCSVNPVKTAATATADNKADNKADTIAFAIYAQYVIVEELAADVKESPGTPPAVKEALKAASIASAPAAESLKAGADTVNGIRAVIASGQACEPPQPASKGLCAADLPGQLLALNNLLTETAPKIRLLTDAYNMAKPLKKVTK